MNRNNVIAATIGMLSLIQVSQASEHGVGNGGIGFRCGENVVLLDALEANDRNFHVDAPANLKTVRELVMYWLNRMASKDNRGVQFQVLADQMLTDIEAARGNEYYGNVILFSNKPNQPTWDSHEKFEAVGFEGCTEKVQIVRRDAIVRSEDRLFRINLALWGKMTVLQQALTVTHEIFYYENEKETDSTNARYLNEAATSVEFEKMSSCDWYDRLRKSGSRVLSYGLAPEVRPYSCYVNGRIKEASVRDDHAYNQVLYIKLTSPVTKGTPEGHFLSTSHVTFSEDDTSIIEGTLLGSQDGKDPISGFEGCSKGDERLTETKFSKTPYGYHLTGKLSRYRSGITGIFKYNYMGCSATKHIGLAEYDVFKDGTAVRTKVITQKE